MSLRIPVVLALAATAGAFLWLDKTAADQAAPGDAAAAAASASPPPASVSRPASGAPAPRHWFSAMQPVPAQGAPAGPPKTRKAVDVVSGLPPVRAIHPSLVGKVRNLPARTLEQRPGDRLGERTVEARSGDVLAPRYGDTVSRQ